jgi:hypothetical protein
MVRTTRVIAWLRVSSNTISEMKNRGCSAGVQVPRPPHESNLLCVLTSLIMSAAKGVCQVVSYSVYPRRAWVNNPEFHRSISHNVGQVGSGWCAAQNWPLTLISL